MSVAFLRRSDMSAFRSMNAMTGGHLIKPDTFSAAIQLNENSERIMRVREGAPREISAATSWIS